MVMQATRIQAGKAVMKSNMRGAMSDHYQPSNSRQMRCKVETRENEGFLGGNK